jgi:hypothetical protein
MLSWARVNGGDPNKSCGQYDRLVGRRWPRRPRHIVPHPHAYRPARQNREALKIAFDSVGTRYLCHSNTRTSTSECLFHSATTIPRFEVPPTYGTSAIRIRKIRTRPLVASCARMVSQDVFVAIANDFQRSSDFDIVPATMITI